MLYHVSESPDIAIFEPRWSDAQNAAIVWAVHELRLHNYLLPRDCPRVCYSAGAHTTVDDIASFLGSSRAVIAVESRWEERVQSTSLYCYELPVDTFRVCDPAAGYYISEQPVTPNAVTRIDDLAAAILERGVELRFMPELVAFGDRVVASTLQFSLIRMRNAGR